MVVTFEFAIGVLCFDDAWSLAFDARYVVMWGVKI